MAELDATMSREEFADWGAFFEEEPWGCLVDDHRMATLLSLLIHVNSTKPNPEIPHFFDRRPDETARRLAARVTSDEEIERMFDAAIARQNGEIG